MGMFSSFTAEDIRVIDWKGLLEFLDEFNKLIH
jgi:hypothetical protein